MASPDTNYGLLEGAPLPEEAPKQRKGGRTLAACALAAVLGAPLYVGSVQRQTSSAAATNLRAAEPNIWTPDQPGAWETQAWEAMFDFKMPYMDFTEDVYVHADQKAGLMRLSYYSGANVFLINTTGSSFELVPVAERESCLVTDSVKKLELVIPELDFFRQNGGKYTKITLTDENGLESVGYEFVVELNPLHISKDGKWEYTIPVQNYVGRYTFVVNATSGGWPVSMSFNGHNPFLVQAHQDEYHMVYKTFHPRPEGIDRSFFTPPIGMPCTPYSNPTGPFKFGNGPRAHMGMFLPGAAGDSHRYSVLRDMYTHFNKSCSTVGECGERQNRALRHYKYIQSRNSLPGRKYQLGVNHMLDWSDDERAMLRGGRPSQLGAASSGKGGCSLFEKNWTGDAPELPVSLDLRDQKLVGPPRDQGTCGSCWAFATIGMLEGQVAKKVGYVMRLSEQHLVDCSWSVGNLACDGGSDLDAQSWLLLKNGGLLPTADSYGRYLSEDGFCHFDKSKHLEGLSGVAAPPPGATEHISVAAQIKSCHLIAGPEYGSLEAAQTRISYALNTVGPLSTGVTSSDNDFYYYAGGIYDDPKCAKLASETDHVVIITGYGVSDVDETPYWWVRNSWSTHWGESGYIRVAKPDNICGLSSAATFSLLY